MTIPEAIATQQREIVVPGSKLSETLKAIREGGGWTWRMEAKAATYTLLIHWKPPSEKAEQQEMKL